MHGQRLSRAPLSTSEFAKRTVIVIAIALVPVLVWFLFDVILITIGAILIAVLLHLLAHPFGRWCHLPRSVALVLSGLFVIGIFGGMGYLFGTHFDAELRDVLSRADTATANIAASLQQSQGGRFLLAHIQTGAFSLPALVGNIFSVSAGLLEALIVTVIAGFYLAAQPDLYRSGFGKLFPQRLRRNVDETLDDIALGLRLWLLGQLIQMALIGVICTIAVLLIGLPSPLALGAIAAVAEFIPYLGPIIAAIPALLVATTKSFDAVLWTLVAYLLIHQIEGNLVVPLIQRRMVFIPPAVMLLGIVAILFAFGIGAAFFAAPIAVILYVAIKKLYVHDALGEATLMPGDRMDSEVNSS